jgi:hypothetical protein
VWFDVFVGIFVVFAGGFVMPLLVFGGVFWGGLGNWRVRGLPVRLRRWLLTLLLFLSACAGVTPSHQWGNSPGPASFQQCVNPYGASNPACVTAGVSAAEGAAPAAVSAGQAVGAAVRAAETLKGLLTLHRFLTGAELDRVEAIIKECVVKADEDVNARIQQGKNGQKFKNGKFPNDTECSKVVRFDENDRPVFLSQELGRLKHANAFDCIKARLSNEYPGSFSIEPRYKADPARNGVQLTDFGPKTLHPDIVIHALRNPVRVQCVYELKFPCLSDHKIDPFLADQVREQLRAYQELSMNCPAAIITPRGLRQLE